MQKDDEFTASPVVIILLVLVVSFVVGFVWGQSYSGTVSDEQILKNAEYMLYSDNTTYVKMVRSMIPAEVMYTYERYAITGTAQTMAKSKLHELCKTVMNK